MFFSSAVILKRESSESQSISTLFLVCKIDRGLETAFLENERIFRIKNCVEFVHLLRSTTMQKKSDFDFLSLATNWRFWSIFAWIRS